MEPITKSFYILFILLFAFGCSKNSINSPTKKDNSETQMDSDAKFNPIKVVQPFPAISDAPFVKGGNIANQLADRELVLGVVINNEAKAYPINMLTGPSREIINDVLGDKAIAATW